MNKILILILILFLKLNNIKAANILALLGIPSPSHHIWNSALTHALAERGHNMTILTPDLPNSKNIPKNAHYIHLEEVYNTMNHSEYGKLDLNEFIGIGPIENIPLLYKWGFFGCLGVTKSHGFDILLNYPDNFKVDLIIHDFTLGPCLIGFAHKFNYPPIVGVSAFLYPPNTIDLTGGLLFPSYVPFYATSSYDINMSFTERMHNTLVYFLDNMYRNYYAIPKINQLIHHKYPKGTPLLNEIDKRTVIALVNSHPSINYPELLPPNVIEVGGMQLKEVRPLPNDINDFISKSKNGIILMAFGTNMQAKDVGLRMTNIFLNTMKNLTQYSFIWKFEHDFSAADIPENILIRKFVPQNDILGNSKTKAFITHCGGLSTQEATWNAVPMIGIPLFVDQMRNMYKSKLTGVGEYIDYLSLNSDILREAIIKVVENDSYKSNMKIRSNRFRDRPIKPLDSAVWWVEYILRDPNPIHLKPPTIDMSYFVVHSLDFISLFLFSFFCLLFILVLFFKFLLKKKIITKKKKN